MSLPGPLQDPTPAQMEEVRQRWQANDPYILRWIDSVRLFEGPDCTDLHALIIIMANDPVAQRCKPPVRDTDKEN